VLGKGQRVLWVGEGKRWFYGWEHIPQASNQMKSFLAVLRTLSHTMPGEHSHKSCTKSCEERFSTD